MRGRTPLALVALTAALVSCASSTETPSAPTTSTTATAAPDRGPTVFTPLLAGVVAAPMQPGFTPREESAVSPLVLDVMTYAGR
jgi:hypothetical protein